MPKHNNVTRLCFQVQPVFLGVANIAEKCNLMGSMIALLTILILLILCPYYYKNYRVLDLKCCRDCWNILWPGEKIAQVSTDIGYNKWREVSKEREDKPNNIWKLESIVNFEISYITVFHEFVCECLCDYMYVCMCVCTLAFKFLYSRVLISAYLLVVT